jgi:hypothetical protein
MSTQSALLIQGALQFYRRTLCVIVPFSASVGFSAGLVENFTTDLKLSPLHVFTNIIGYTTLGVATGVTYPLTFPVIMHSVLI